MKIFLISLTVISSILMIAVILLQQGKGADLGAAFGRGAQGGLFTATGKANFLTRTTSVLVTVFLVSALWLSLHLGGSRKDEVLEELQKSVVESIPEAGGETTSASSALPEDEDSPEIVGEGDDASASDTPDGGETNY